MDPNSDETLWEPWVEGVERAMRLRPEAWLEIVESGDEEAAASVSPILAMVEMNENTTDSIDAALDEIDEKGPALIGNMVRRLNAWTKAPRRTGKIGRDEPCPCGAVGRIEMGAGRRAPWGSRSGPLARKSRVTAEGRSWVERSRCRGPS